MATKLVLPRPPESYDARAEAQRNLLLEQAFSRVGGGAAASALAQWGNISGTITNQTDLMALGRPWAAVTAGQTLVPGDRLVATITTTQNFPLPSALTAGDMFIVANARGSTTGALARIQTGSSQRIIGAAVDDDVTVAPGETIYLVARSTTLLEIV